MAEGDKVDGRQFVCVDFIPYQQSKWNKSLVADLGEIDSSDVQPEQGSIRCGERDLRFITRALV